MKRLMTAVCCACVLGAAGLSAGQTDKKMDKRGKNVTSITVTGCVAEKGGHYMLNNAMMAGDTMAMAYDLMGGDLKAHVGHKAEVTGSTDSKMMAKGKMDKDKMMEKDKMAMSGMHGTLHVKTVKMIATTCQ